MTSSNTLIDVHAHFVTDDYTSAAKEAGHTHADGMPGEWPIWDAGEKLALMDKHGIRTAVLSISTPGVHFGDDLAARQLSRHVNGFAADNVKRHPGRFLQFASIPLPDVAGALTEIAFSLDVLGAAGVAVYTNTHGMYLGNEHFEPVWAELDARRAIVFVHPTSPPHWEAVSLNRPRPIIEFPFETTRAVADLIFSGVFGRYPNIQWIIPHNGGTLPFLADRMNAIGQYTGSLDISNGTVREQLERLWFDSAGTPFPVQLPTLAKMVGDSRLLYGSDSCWTPVETIGKVIASLDAAAPPSSADSWRQLTTRNAECLIPATAPVHF